MASEGDKENNLAQKHQNSRIPVRKRPNLAAQWGRENLISRVDRNPLIEIQPSAAGKSTNDERKVQETLKKQTRVPQHVSVVRITRSKTTTNLVNDRARFVTLRKTEESPLDWGLKVFQDSGPKIRRENTTIQPQSNRQHSTRSKSVERPSGGQLARNFTPRHIPVAQYNRVKNIKRSLKRPSSRELQNRSCQTESGVDLPQVVPLELTHAQDHRLRVADNTICTDNNTRQLTIAHERHIVRHLLVSGQKNVFLPNICTLQRGIVVNWLVKLHNAQDFDSDCPQVLQVAVTHLDRVLALETIPTEKVQLFAAVCYWLAQKQCGKPLSSGYIARYSAGAFCCLDMRATERYIVKKMGWPTIPIVADDFVPYLVLVCSPEEPDLLNAGATFLCTIALLDKKFCFFTPDVIAVAAIANCLLHLDLGSVKTMEDNIVYRKASSHPRFNDVRDLMLRSVLLMQADKCQRWEPYLQYSKPPLKVSERLAESLLAKGITAENFKPLIV